MENQEPATPTTKSLSPRHEAFCQHYVLCGNATVAALNAGYSSLSVRNQGYRLTHRADTRTRIADIRRGLARAYCLDAEVLLGKLEAIYQCANESRNFHAATRAVDLQARIVRQMAPSPSEKIPDRETARGEERSDRDQKRGEEPRRVGSTMGPSSGLDMENNPDQTRGEEGPQTSRGPDREINMTTNDDILRPQADEFVANSIPCTASGRRK